MSVEARPTEQVRRAKARYCRFVDTKMWEELGALFVAEPEIRIYGPDGAPLYAFDRREDFVAASRAYLAQGARSIHQVHNDEIDQVSETEIQAIWSMEDMIVVDQPDADRPARMHGYGHYHETWVATPDGWRIARLTLRRTILEFVRD